MLRDLGGKVPRDRVVLAGGESKFGQRLDRVDAALLEPAHDVDELELVSGGAEGWSRPERQRVGQPTAGLVGRGQPGGGQAIADELLEAVEVDRLRGHLEDVAALSELDHRFRVEPEWGQRLAEVRDVAADRDLRPRWWCVAPQHVDDAVEWDDLAGMQEQRREHGTLLGSAQVDLAVWTERADPAEHAECRRGGAHSFRLARRSRAGDQRDAR